MKLHHLNHSGLNILVPSGVLDALGSIPNCGPAHAGTVGYHLGDLDAVVRRVGGLVDRGQEHTQEEEVGGDSHGSEQERKVRTTLQLLLN